MHAAVSSGRSGADMGQTQQTKAKNKYRNPSLALFACCWIFRNALAREDHLRGSDGDTARPAHTPAAITPISCSRSGHGGHRQRHPPLASCGECVELLLLLALNLCEGIGMKALAVV